MSDTSEYMPPKVWTWNRPNGGQFASINRPIAGPTHEKDLPVGKHPLQLYSLATPNGVKVTIMLEELLALGHAGAEYDAWLIKIGDGEQFGTGFVAANPNSKIFRHCWTAVDLPPSACLNPGRSFYTSQSDLAPSYQVRLARARNVCRGYSGKWEARRMSAAALATSMRMHLSRSNMQSTALRWRRSANLTCWTANSPSISMLLEIPIP